MLLSTEHYFPIWLQEKLTWSITSFIKLIIITIILKDITLV